MMMIDPIWEFLRLVVAMLIVVAVFGWAERKWGPFI